MSLGGPIDSMINNYRSNIRMLTGRMRLRQGREDHSVNYPGSENVFKQGVIGEMEQFNARMRKDRRRDHRRFLIILGVTVILILVIMYAVVTTDYTEVIEVVK